MITLPPVWAVVRCGGGCAQMFTGNARTAPMWGGKPYCRSCWDRANRLRGLLGLTVFDAPADAWPDPTSDDPMVNGTGAG